MRRTLRLLLCWALSGCDCSPDPTHGPDNQPPAVTILAPPDGTSLHTGTLVALMGEAIDPEEGALTNLAWSSSLTGDLGVGASVMVELAVGEHAIVLVAVDRQGARGRDQITLTVTAANASPLAFIDDPASGSIFTEGDSVTLWGRGTDSEDGTLPGVALNWTSSLDGALGSGATLGFTPSLGVHVVVLTAIDSEGAQGQASIQIEVVPVGINQAPVVNITEPESGAAFNEGEVVACSGTAVDPEEGALAGAALTWTSDRDGVLGQGEDIARADLSLGVHTLSLAAVDSEGASGSASVTVSINPVATTPPTATIASPTSGAAFAAGATVTFLGSGTDAEDGALSGAALAWRSSVDGELGTGSPLPISTLTVGPHTITLTATDSSGASGTDQITLTILAPNQPPSAQILAPADGAQFTAGTLITFDGSADDAEDGTLTGSALLWSSNLDGAMGSGAPLAYGSLTAGLHTITLTAIDSAGATGSDNSEVLVLPAAQNLPPTARLSAPNQGTAGVPVVFDGSASSDPDGSIVDYHFDFGNAEPAQSGSATSAQHTFTSDGTYLVTLTVTDNEGATHATTRTLVVGVTPQVPVVVADVADALGSVCDLEIDSTDVPHVIYRNNTHPSLWYATFAGGAWNTELVDGMGWDTGGIVRTDMALTLDATGVPHIVYILDVGSSVEARYATRSGGTWLIETIEAGTNFEPHVDIELGSGGQPVVLYTRWISGTGYVPRIAARSGANSWPLSTTSGSFRGGGALELDSGGVMHVSLVGSSLLYANTWTTTGWGTAASFAAAASTSRVPLALDAAGHDVLMHQNGIAHDLGGRNWSHSEIESAPITYYDLASDAAVELQVGLGHAGQLELAHSIDGGYWHHVYAGPMDPTYFGVTVDNAGALHACFFRSANLVYY